MKAIVKVNISSIVPKISNATEKVTHIVTQQVLKDSNFYAPEDRGYAGGLIGSGVDHVDVKTGKITWAKPYARRLYKGVTFNFSKDKNPNAQAMWYDKAKSVHLNDWVQVAKKGFEQLI